jgi:hypothetical protein
MLVSKLLRIEEKLVEQIEELAKKMSETEYTSFSALARKLIKNGLKMLPHKGQKTNIISIPRVHYSGLNPNENLKDQEMDNILGALDCYYDCMFAEHKSTESDEGEIKKNHLMIEWRSDDHNGDHFGVGITPIDYLNNGDEIYIGLPNLYKLIVITKNDNEAGG